MFKMKIINKEGVETHFMQNQSQEELQKWHDGFKDTLLFGLPERLVLQSECTEEQLASALELIPEVTQIIPAQDAIELLDENGQSFDPPQFSQASVERVEVITPAMARLPAEYTIEIEDITAQVEQEKINQEALAYLASTDWLIIREVDSGIACSAEIKQLRQAARDSIIR